MENKRRKQVGILFLVALLVCIVAGCGGWNRVHIEKQDSAIRKQKVTLIAKSTESAFWKSVFAGAGAASTEYNMELKCIGPDNEEDYITQNRMIEEAVTDGTDVIVFSYRIPESFFSALPIFCRGIKVNDSDIDLFLVHVKRCFPRKASRLVIIRTDSAAHLFAIYITVYNNDLHSFFCSVINCLCIPLIINRRKYNHICSIRHCLFNHSILCYVILLIIRDTVGKDKRAVIVDTINVNSTIDSAKEEAEKLLERIPEINVLVTFNEWTSLGVGYAVKEAGLADSVRVVAFDSNVVSVDMLETGEVDALIVQNPYAMGYLGVENAYRLLGGHDLDEREVNTSTHLVTKENMYSEESQRMLFSFDEIR